MKTIKINPADNVAVAIDTGMGTLGLMQSIHRIGKQESAA